MQEQELEEELKVFCYMPVALSVSCIISIWSSMSHVKSNYILG